MQRIRSLINYKKHAVRFASSTDWINLCTGHSPDVINRASHLRKDAGWLKSNSSSSDSDFIVFMKRRPITEFVSNKNSDLQMSRYSYSELQPYLKDQDDHQPLCVFLGIDGNRPLFLISFDQKVKDLLNEKRHILEGFVTLKPLVDRRTFCYARSLLFWNKSHLFCGHCGSPTESCDGGHKRVCPNPDCSRNDKRSYGDHAISHPRTDPAVLVVITDGQRCFLARKASFPPNMLSCIAGFVEPGETLEDAVVREVLEETGLAVTSVRYLLSQPWPFDSIIKFGCLATVESTDFVLDEEELSFADWFSLSEIRSMLQGRHLQWIAPMPHLLAHQVLNLWVNENLGEDPDSSKPDK